MRSRLPKEEYGEAANGYDPRILRRSTQSHLPHCNIQKSDPLRSCT
jgi:hypothetical protein